MSTQNKRTIFLSCIVLSGVMLAAGCIPSAGARTANPQTQPVVPLVKALPLSNVEIGLSWSEVPGAKEYKLFLVEGEKLQPIATTASLSYKVGSLKPGTNYAFQVVPAGDSGPGTPSAVESSATKAYPTVPQAVRATAVGNHRIDLSWDAALAGKKYEVYHVNNRSTPILSTSETSASINGLEAGATYQFFVVASNSDGAGEPSDIITVQTQYAPENVGVRGSPGGLQISWSDISHATRYEIFRSLNGQNFASIGSTTKTTFTDPNTETAKTYWYEVRAYIGSSPGIFSNAVRAQL